MRHFSEAAPHFQVDAVHTCAEALARLEQPHEYDLVLIDLRMPDQSGLDFAREAKRRRGMPPFIMVTGKGDDATAITTLKLGAADYIVKREGYLNQLVYTIEQAIAYNQVKRLNEQLQAELAARKRVGEELRKLTAELEQRVAERTKELQQKAEELERFNKLFVGRELRMIELKEKIKELESRIQ